MKLKSFVKNGVRAVILALSSCLTCQANVTINEIMPCNLATLMSDTWNFESFIELKNDDSSPVSLKGYSFVQYKKKGALKWECAIGDSVSIDANGYLIIWADESTASGHLAYKLDADGGSLVLKHDGVTIDSLNYGKQVPHLSYGRKGETAGYMLPSPDAENTFTPVATLKRTSSPVFSEEAGLRSASFDLTLTCADTSCTIYYTTNGSNPYPSHGGKAYTGPISIDGTTIVRAMAYDTTLLPSEIVTESFIFEDKAHSKCNGYTLPIVSLSTDKDYLSDNEIGLVTFGTNGIAGPKECTRAAANYNQDWKRPLNFEYLVDGKQVLSREVEAAVEGGCSRIESVKSLSLKASKKTGNDELAYHFFNSKPDLIHQTVHLRNGGTAYAAHRVRFRDGMNQTLAIGMNIDYQAYQPVAYYLNGEYQGLMNLNERSNVDYLKANYGLDDDEVDFITISDATGVNASRGTVDAYDELVDYLENTDANSADFYAGACKRMDMDEYIDYQCFQQFIANVDWPGNNTKIWRERKDGARLRWIVFDTDFGFGLPDFDYLGGSDNDMIKWCRGDEGHIKWGNCDSWMTLIFRDLSNNAQFNKKFTTKFLIHLSTTFNNERLEAVFDSITSLVSSEYCATFDRDAANDVAKMKTFAFARSGYILSQLQEFMNTGEAVQFDLDANVDNAVFTINGEKVNGFHGKYLTGFNSEIKVYAPEGYRFDHWEISDSSFTVENKIEDCSGNLPGSITGSLNAVCSLKAIFTADNTIETTLVINELCASSNEQSGVADDYGTYPDWIEVYNYGTYAIDMAGCYFSNKESNLKLSQIPYGSDSTIVKPGEHKLFWAKGDAVDGPLYLNFNMNVDKSKTIYLTDMSGNEISSATYKTHPANASYGYETDNAGDWILFDICENDTTLFTATPGNENGTVNCTGTDITDIEVQDNIVLYPNPAHDVLHVQSDNVLTDVEIREAKGLLMLSSHPHSTAFDLSVSNLPQGIYFVTLRTSNDVEVKKLIVK